MAFYSETGENFDEMFVANHEFIDRYANADTIIGTGGRRDGQLGIGSNTPISRFQTVPSITGIKQISCGQIFTMALKTDGALISVGGTYNNAQYGELGIGSITGYNTFQTVPSITGIKQIECGAGHTIALKTDGTLLSCGQNTNGQLGLGNITSYSTFQTVPGVTGFKQVAGGQNFTFALKTDGTLLSCGNNTYGQLGINSTTTSNYSTFQTVPGITGIKQISCGYNHTIALKTDGTLLACGNNGGGQLGINSATTSKYSTFQIVPAITSIKQISCGQNHTIALKTDGTLLACGNNGSGQLGINSTTTSKYSTFQTVPSVTGVKQVACGYSHTIALKTDGTLLSCGYNGYGQLGINSTTTSNYSTFQTVPSVTGVKQVACGYSQTMVLQY